MSHGIRGMITAGPLSGPMAPSGPIPTLAPQYATSLIRPSMATTTATPVKPQGAAPLIKQTPEGAVINPAAVKGYHAVAPPGQLHKYAHASKYPGGPGAPTPR